MRRSLPDAVAREVRLRAQRLSTARPEPVSTVVAEVAALQAQSTPAARLAVRARAGGDHLTAADVDAACADRRVVRTWLLRGTLHMVAAADLRWMLSLVGPVAAAAQRRRRQELGLDDAVCERGLALIGEALAGSPPLTRAELLARLTAAGLPLDPTGQAPAHLLCYAALRGLICRGPERGAEPTYVLLDDWVPGGRTLDRDEALAELARRYLAAHGPATVRDFMWWSGLPAAPARRAFALIAAEVTEVEAFGAPAVALSATDLETGPARSVRLLGNFDAYLLGFRSRDPVLDPCCARRVLAGGVIRAAVLVDGRVAGTWRLVRRAGLGRVVVEPCAEIAPDRHAELAAEAAAVGRFLGVETALDLAAPGRGPGTS